MANDNDLRIVIYSSGTTALDRSEYDHAQGLTYGTAYPVGFTDCTFFLPGDPTYLGLIAHKMTVAIYNGFDLAWAGRVTNKRIAYSEDLAGIYIDATGHFGDILNQQKIRKPWADTRVGDDIWQDPLTAASANDRSLDKACQIETSDGIKFIPRSMRDAAGAEVGWANGDYVRRIITAPTGQTIKRITGSATLAEAAQQWGMRLYDRVGATSLVSITTSTTTAWDHTLATPRQSVELQFYNGLAGAQTPPTDGTVYAIIKSLVVYTETGSINPTEIIYDVLGYATEFSTDTSQVATNTTSLVPFVADPMSYAEIIAKVASYGDSSFNPYGYGVRSLDSTNKPILFYEAYPALTDYDYIVTLTEQQLQQFEAEQNVEDVINYVSVGYNDESGRQKWITPDDDSSLTDATSVAAYGRRDIWVTINTTNSTAATQQGKKILADHKDLQWRGSASIPVVGTIQKKGGQPWPVSLIKAGERVKIGNYLNNLNGSGLTLLITETKVTDDGDTVTNVLTVGNGDSVAVSLARIEENIGA